jgi:hypothetical protein
MSEELLLNKKRELVDWISLKSIVSPLNFEKKMIISQNIKKTQNEIDDINFKLFEDKFEQDDIIDILFEQSFHTLDSRYTNLFADKSQEGDYFAPDGKVSKYSDEINLMIRTPLFKQWFGDWELAYSYREIDALGFDCSKVVNENYEPLLVWHGTGAQFSYFRFDNFPAAYFAVNHEFSEFFANLQSKDGEGYVLPFFLNVRSPLDLSIFGNKEIEPKDFFDYIFIKTGLSKEELDLNPVFLDPNCPPRHIFVFLRWNANMLKKIADSKVFDGIYFVEVNPNLDPSNPAKYSNAYIVFDPNQIKLADPSKGELLFSSMKSFLLKRGGKI